MAKKPRKKQSRRSAKRPKRQWVIPPNLSVTPEFRSEMGAHATLTPALKKSLERLAKRMERAGSRGMGWKCDNVTLCDEVQINCSGGVSVTLCEALVHCDDVVTYGDPSCSELA